MENFVLKLNEEKFAKTQLPNFPSVAVSVALERQQLE